MKKLLLFLPLALIVMLFSFSSTSLIKITGTVKDENGNGLAGVAVQEKGTNNGTNTDAQGAYSITVNGKNSVLSFHYLGFERRSVRVQNNLVVDVILKPAKEVLHEVIVGGKIQDRRTKTVNGYDMGSPSIAPYHNQNIGADYNTEEYDHITENGFHKVVNDPLSTFSIDVDAASYSNVRRFLNNNELPQIGAVRIEEMINYFRYNYPQPTNEDPFSITTDMATAPWNPQHKLVMIGLQGKKIPMEKLPSSNLVFLIDVSGSMDGEMRLPLVQSSMKLLTDQLREQDKISIVVYAGNAGLVLPATSGANKIKIKEAIDQLKAGGSTAGGEGIKLAYKIAQQNFIKNGNNRIILCTDGDFNVGVSSNDELQRIVEKERESGVFLTVLGYGMGNYKDSKMQLLADKGNGNHAYIDGINEAKKVLVSEFGGTLFTIAKDVKLQVEFNPAKVQGYRLIGYENRMLKKEDFNDDKKDAGDLGSGHTVTALYEIIPVGVQSEFLKDVDPLKYQKDIKMNSLPKTNEMLTVKFRYKAPDGDKSSLIQKEVLDRTTAFDQASENLRFAASVAEFGMLLRDSEFKKGSSFQHALATAKNASSYDVEGYRKEFISLIEKAHKLKSKKDEVANKD